MEQLDHTGYTQPLPTLSGSSIGQHVRHIVEFYQCMLNGYENALINYDNRSRNKLIEESREFALQCIHKILSDLPALDLSRQVTLEVEYEETIRIATTLERELVYNIEHAIHHMALIRIGLRELGEHILLPVEFGLAASTLRYQQHVHRNLLANR